MNYLIIFYVNFMYESELKKFYLFMNCGLFKANIDNLSFFYSLNSNQSFEKNLNNN